jgi:iron complex transport system substrate-binding protein
MKSTLPKIPLPASTCWAGLNRESNAKAYTDFYRQQLHAIARKRRQSRRKATVLSKRWPAIATPAALPTATAAGGLVEAVGANNIGSQLLPGASGFVSLEKIISMKPMPTS